MTHRARALSDVPALIATGEIADAKTIIGLCCLAIGSIEGTSAA